MWLSVIRICHILYDNVFVRDIFGQNLKMQCLFICIISLSCNDKLCGSRLSVIFVRYCIIRFLRQTFVAKVDTDSRLDRRSGIGLVLYRRCPDHIFFWYACLWYIIWQYLAAAVVITIVTVVVTIIW